MAIVLYVLENLDSAPGAVAVSIGNGGPDSVGETVEVTLDGDPEVLLTTDMPDDGNIRTNVRIPAGVTSGSHYLTATMGSGSDSAPFQVLHDGLDSTDDPGDDDPVLPDIPAPFGRWTLIDVYPGEEETWTFPRNAQEWDGPPERPKFLVFDAACGPSGQVLTWQNSNRAWETSFSGVIFTRDEYHDLHRWSAKHRRFWLYDHRHVIWFVTFTSFEPKPRARGVVFGEYDPWLHDYTMQCLVFNKPGDQPFVIEEDVAVP